MRELGLGFGGVRWWRGRFGDLEAWMESLWWGLGRKIGIVCDGDRLSGDSVAGCVVVGLGIFRYGGH